MAKHGQAATKIKEGNSVGVGVSVHHTSREENDVPETGTGAEKQQQGRKVGIQR